MNFSVYSGRGSVSSSASISESTHIFGISGRNGLAVSAGSVAANRTRSGSRDTRYPPRDPAMISRRNSAPPDKVVPMDRRDFLVLPAASLATSLFAAENDAPWQRRIRRVGQTNMTEHDPAVLDVEQWADYWASLKVDAVLVSVTGILAFYPTKVPFHRKGKFLGDRDFYGECCAAAKKRGLRVIARMSPDLNWEDAVEAHPEWFQRDSQGNAVHHTEDRRLFRTCMFTSYMTDYMPAIMREINSLY